MKKVLGLAVLMMVILVSVSGLAQVEDSIDIPVYLNVPEFVSLSVHPDDDGQFDWEIDFATEEATLTDTVVLKAEANVDYNLSAAITLETLNATWTSILGTAPEDGDGIEVDLSPSSGAPGITEIDAEASLEGYDLNDVVDLETLLSAGDLNNQKVAEITFTISSL